MYNRPYIAFSSRLLNLLNYQNESTNTYSIDKIPSTVGWGVNRPFDNKIKVLCKYSTNELVILWVVGKVSKYWFANSKGEPAAQVNVHVVPLTDGAGRRARTIISSLSKPSERAYIFSVDLTTMRST